MGFGSAVSPPSAKLCSCYRWAYPYDQTCPRSGTHRRARYLVPFILAAAAGYYAWAGRDTDMAAVIRHQADERQAYRQLEMQALVGKVMSVAAVVAYLAAFAVKATLWPFAIFVALPGLTLFAGWVIYREHGDGQTTTGT